MRTARVYRLKEITRVRQAESPQIIRRATAFTRSVPTTHNNSKWTETILVVFALMVGLASYGIPLRGLVGEEELLADAVRDLTTAPHWKSSAAATETPQGATHGFLLRTLKNDSALQSGKTTEVDLPRQTTGNFRAISDHYARGHGRMKLTVVVKSPRSGDRSCGINRHRTESELKPTLEKKAPLISEETYAIAIDR